MQHSYHKNYPPHLNPLSLCKKLLNLDFEVQLVIRLRDIKNEINSNILEENLKQFGKLVKISKNTTLSEDIVNCDCLIALSSTTLEDATNCGTPAMSYGLSNYDHFNFYNHSKYKIHANLRNYNKMKKVEKVLGRNFIYLEDRFLKREKSIFDYI